MEAMANSNVPGSAAAPRTQARADSLTRTHPVGASHNVPDGLHTKMQLQMEPGLFMHQPESLGFTCKAIDHGVPITFGG